MKSDFSLRLLRLMHQRRMSQEDLAAAVFGEIRDRLGIKVPRSLDRIEYYITGKRVPTPETLKRIAEVLGTTVAELTGRDV